MTTQIESGSLPRWNWREKFIPLVLVQAIIFLLFRPLLWADVQAIQAAEAGARAGVWGNFAADLVAWALAAFAVCLILLDRMGPIAINTFKEAVRNRILYFILLFALVLMGSSGVVKELAIGAQDRIIRDLGLASISLFGLMVAILVGISLVYTELDKKSIYTIVSKPLHRYQYLLGKFFGLLLTIYIIVAVMTLFFFMVVNYQANTTDEIIEQVLYSQTDGGYWEPVANMGWVKFTFLARAFALSAVQAVGNIFGFAYGAVSPNLLIQVAMILLTLMIVTAFAVFYSSFTTPTLSAVFTVLTFLAGRLNEDIVRFGMQLAQNSLEREGVASLAELSMAATMRIQLVRGVALIVPNLDSLDVSADVLQQGIIQVWRFPVLYAFCYTATILMLAILIFRKRNFK